MSHVLNIIQWKSQVIFLDKSVLVQEDIHGIAHTYIYSLTHVYISFPAYSNVCISTPFAFTYIFLRICHIRIAYVCMSILFVRKRIFSSWLIHRSMSLDIKIKDIKITFRMLLTQAWPSCQNYALGSSLPSNWWGQQDPTGNVFVRSFPQ